jgi:putative ABC transport system substrate-binding protein
MLPTNVHAERQCMQFIQLKRRELLALLSGGAAAASPFGVHAQQLLPLIGFMSGRSAKDSEPHTAGFLRGLSEGAYIAGQNIRIEYRWADGHYERLPELAAELVGMHPAALAAAGGEPSALAAKSATSTIPIVFVRGDPVKTGITASLNRPNSNATGISFVTYQLGGQRVNLIAELVPNAATIALLVNPNMSETDTHIESVRTGPDTLHRRCSCSGQVLEPNYSRASSA